MKLVILACLLLLVTAGSTSSLGKLSNTLAKWAEADALSEDLKQGGDWWHSTRSFIGCSSGWVQTIDLFINDIDLIVQNPKSIMTYVWVALSWFEYKNAVAPYRNFMCTQFRNYIKN